MNQKGKTDLREYSLGYERNASSAAAAAIATAVVAVVAVLGPFNGDPIEKFEKFIIHFNGFIHLKAPFNKEEVDSTSTSTSNSSSSSKQASKIQRRTSTANRTRWDRQGSLKGQVDFVNPVQLEEEILDSDVKCLEGEGHIVDIGDAATAELSASPGGERQFAEVPLQTVCEELQGRGLSRLEPRETQNLNHTRTEHIPHRGIHFRRKEGRKEKEGIEGRKEERRNHKDIQV